MPTNAELYEKYLENNRNRQRKYYTAHKEEIKKKKRDDRAELARLKTEVALLRAGGNPAPTEPCEECQQNDPEPPAVLPRRLLRKKTPQAPEIVEPDEPDEPEPEPAPVAPNNKRKQKIQYTVEVIVNKLKTLEFKSEATRKKYIRDITSVFNLTKCQYFEACVKQVEKIKKYLETAKQKNGQPYGINSILAYLQSIRYCYTRIPEITIPEDIKRRYNEIIDVYKVRSKEQTKRNKLDLDKGVITTDEYMERIDTTFGEGSKESLIANLYLNVPARDNFELYVVVNVIEANKDKTKNYIIVPRTKANCKIILNKYKTANKYLDLTYDLDANVSTLVRDWINEENIAYGNTIFKEKKLSDYISKFHKKINITGSINYLRHMIVSSQKLDEMSIEQLVKEATKFGHSAQMHRDYCRVLLAKS